MKRFIVLFILIFLVILSSLPLFAAADKNVSVYAEGEELETVYSATQNDSFANFYNTMQIKHLKIDKQTITPVYTVDMLSFAETGVFQLQRQTTEAGGEIYTAKVLTEDNRHAGNLRFEILNGVAVYHLFTITSAMPEHDDSSNSPASCSYADHAERIRQLLGREEFVDVTDVRFVSIKQGSFFCITTDKEPVFIPVGSKNGYSSQQDRTVFSLNDLKEMADAQLEREKQNQALYEAWVKEHPGESFTNTGGTVIPVVCYVDNVENVQDVAAYLHSAKSDNARIAVLWIGAISSASLIALTAVLVIRKAKKRPLPAFA